MGWQTNRILETIGTATGGTQSINYNLEAIEALMVTLQADVADGIKVDGASATTISTFTSATSADVLTASTARKGATFYSAGVGSAFLSLGTSTTSTNNYSLIVSQNDSATVTGYTGKVTGLTTGEAILHVTSFS
jgi:hypothetical protein